MQGNVLFKIKFILLLNLYLNINYFNFKSIETISNIKDLMQILNNTVYKYDPSRSICRRNNYVMIISDFINYNFIRLYKSNKTMRI